MCANPQCGAFEQVREDVVMEESQDVKEMDSGNVADRIMYYEVDDSETVHYLSLLDYFTRADALAGAWYVCGVRQA